jgi:LacI family transcriptional regulator
MLSTKKKSNELNHIVSWLKKLPRPVAIFACNDIRAWDVLEACKMANLKVPDDFAVMGVDDDEINCNLFTPSLSSIALNYEQGGLQAAQLLQKLISGKRIHSDTVIVNPKFVVERQSTDILCVEDADVANAVRYIRQNCHKIIQVSDVLKYSSVSRRSLEVKFKQTFGHTIHDEICKNHANYIARLLVESDTPIANITRSIGYTSKCNISRFFKKAMGCTPLQYRKKYGIK